MTFDPVVDGALHGKTDPEAEEREENRTASIQDMMDMFGGGKGLEKEEAETEEEEEETEDLEEEDELEDEDLEEDEDEEIEAEAEEEDESEAGTDDSEEEQGPEQDEDSSSATAVDKALLDLERKRIEREKAELEKSKKEQEEKPKEPQAAGDFNMQIPPDLLTRIQDPDTTKNGLEALLNGAANIIESVVLKKVDELFQQGMKKALPVFAQQQQEVQRQQLTIRQDFYGTFPAYDNEKYYDLVVATTQDVMSELGASEWSPSLKTAVAARMKEITKIDGKTAPVKPRGKKKIAAKKSGRRKARRGKRPPRTTRAGARPNSKGSPEPGSAKDIQDQAIKMYTRR